MAVRSSALRAGRPLLPRNIPGSHFCYRLSRPQGHSAAGKVRLIEKKFNDIIGNGTRDLPACSKVSEPTTELSRARGTDDDDDYILIHSNTPSITLIMLAPQTQLLSFRQPQKFP
jgi:hypothetical protein